MLTRSIKQIGRYLQPIHILKTYCSLPSISLFLLSRLAVDYILVKFAHFQLYVLVFITIIYFAEV